MTRLEATLTRIYEAEPAPEEHLYREVGTEIAEEVKVQLIPYYTWNNRGISEMTVWLPRC